MHTPVKFQIALVLFTQATFKLVKVMYKCCEFFSCVGLIQADHFANLLLTSCYKTVYSSTILLLAKLCYCTPEM